jgi:hypothetical protein
MRRSIAQVKGPDPLYPVPIRNQQRWLQPRSHFRWLGVRVVVDDAPFDRMFDRIASIYLPYVAAVIGGLYIYKLDLGDADLLPARWTLSTLDACLPSIDFRARKRGPRMLLFKHVSFPMMVV